MKTIGLLVDVEGNKASFNFAYLHFSKKFGEVKLIHPYSRDVEKIDLLILPGGQDVHPLRYGQTKVPWECMSQNDNYEYFDGETLPKYIENQIPIFGICRGLQTLNVIFGGTLHQHVEEPSSLFRSQPVHSAFDTQTSFIYKVNSLHHQAIDKVGKGFLVSLQGFKKEKKTGLVNTCIEGIRHKTLPISAVQFHPEELTGPETQNTSAWVEKEINLLLNSNLKGKFVAKEEEEEERSLALSVF